MKILAKISLLSLFVVMLTLSSCKKYDEGPMLSLRSKTERVANVWKVAKATALLTNTDVTDDFKDDYIEFTKDGDYLSSGVKAGTWAFTGDKDKIIVDYTGGIAYTYKIIKLKEKEFWIKDDDGTLELHFEPK